MVIFQYPAIISQGNMRGIFRCYCMLGFDYNAKILHGNRFYQAKSSHVIGILPCDIIGVMNSYHAIFSHGIETIPCVIMI